MAVECRGHATNRGLLGRDSGDGRKGQTTAACDASGLLLLPHNIKMTIGWLSTTMLRRVCGRGEKFAKLWTARVSSVQHSGRCHDVEMKEVGWLVGRFRGADFVCSSMFPGCSHGCSHFVGGPCVRMFSLHGFHFVLRHFVFDICRFLSLDSTETCVVLRLRKLKL